MWNLIPYRTRSKLNRPYLPGTLYKTGVSRVVLNGSQLSSTDDKVNGNAFTWSEDECIDQLHRKGTGGKYVEGGEVDIRSIEFNAQEINVHAFTGNPSSGWYREYTGVLIPKFVSAPYTFSTLPTPAWGGIGSYGPTAWKMYKPGKPQMGLTEFIVELRDAPRLLQLQAKHFRDIAGAGGDYLNVQFGWRPFLSDLRKMFELSKNIEREFAKFERNNGKWIRRSGSVFDTKDTLSWEKSGLSAYGFQPAVDGSLWVSSTVKGTSEYGRNVWFSGSFRYFVPPIKMENKYWRRNFVRKLYGLSLTPAAVWELTPWSWLIDYFTNVGDVINNMSTGVYGEVAAKYAYVMGTTQHKLRQQSSVTLKGCGALASTVSCTISYKQREAASPFGFGISEGSLSPFQISILGALGLTKFR